MLLERPQNAPVGPAVVLRPLARHAAPLLVHGRCQGNGLKQGCRAARMRRPGSPRAYSIQ
jgi:hypothetical protein